jgi:hypothetical protein
MVKVILVGFNEVEITIDISDIKVSSFTSKIPPGMTLREHIVFIQSETLKSNAIVINTEKEILSIEELYLLQIAVNNNIPIFGVGQSNNKLINEIILNSFDTLDEALEHINIFWRGLHENI